MTKEITEFFSEESQSLARDFKVQYPGKDAKLLPTGTLLTFINIVTGKGGYG
jgi:hypothetical protein